MATPVLALTYLSGTYLVAPVAIPHPAAFQPHPVVGSRMVVPPPLWLRIQWAKPQSAAPMRLQRSFRVSPALQASVLTLFWRKGCGRPLKGQLWPRTR